MTKINHFIFGNKIYSNIVIFVFIVFVSNQCFDTIEISSLLPVSISQKNITSQGKINESSSLKTSKQSAIVPAIAVAPGEQLEVRCLVQWSHLSRGIEGGENARCSLPPPAIAAGPDIRTHNLRLQVLRSIHLATTSPVYKQ